MFAQGDTLVCAEALLGEVILWDKLQRSEAVLVRLRQLYSYIWKVHIMEPQNQATFL